MQDNNNQKITTVVIVSIIIVLALAFFGYRFWQSGSVVEDAATQAILQDEADKINPFNQEEVTNPFEKSTNPYKDIKTNPFE